MTIGVFINLLQEGDCIQGRIDLPADQTLTMECLVLVVAQLARQAKLPPAEVAQDLLTLVKGKQ